MDLNAIIHFSNISETIIKLRLSRIDLINKMPHKKDLIDSNTNAENNLTEAYLYFKKLELELTASRKRNYDLENIALNLRDENRQLKNQNENIKNNLQI